jgi:hypothetical protein
MGIFNPATYDESPDESNGGHLAEVGLVPASNKRQRTKARDSIEITEGRISLYLDPAWLPPEVAKGGLIPELTEYLKPLFLSWRQAVRDKAKELIGRSSTDEQAWDELNDSSFAPSN